MKSTKHNKTEAESDTEQTGGGQSRGGPGRKEIDEKDLGVQTSNHKVSHRYEMYSVGNSQ